MAPTTFGRRQKRPFNGSIIGKRQSPSSIKTELLKYTLTRVSFLLHMVRHNPLEQVHGWSLWLWQPCLFPQCCRHGTRPSATFQQCSTSATLTPIRVGFTLHSQQKPDLMEWRTSAGLPVGLPTAGWWWTS